MWPLMKSSHFSTIPMLKGENDLEKYTTRRVKTRQTRENYVSSSAIIYGFERR